MRDSAGTAVEDVLHEADRPESINSELIETVPEARSIEA